MRTERIKNNSDMFFEKSIVQMLKSSFVLNPCIEMNVDAGEDGEECILTAVTYVHLMKVIVIEHTVIDAFSAGTVLVDFFPRIGSVRKRSGIPGAVTIVDIDDSSIV